MAHCNYNGPIGSAAAGSSAPAGSQPDFFKLHGGQALSVGTGICLPQFTVEDLYLAFKRRINLELSANNGSTGPEARQ